MLLNLGRSIYSDTGTEEGGGGGWGAAARRVGRSIAPVPSCMPCMSFLVFEAILFFLSGKEKEQIKNRDIICTGSWACGKGFREQGPDWALDVQTHYSKIVSASPHLSVHCLHAPLTCLPLKLKNKSALVTSMAVFSFKILLTHRRTSVLGRAKLWPL